MFTLALAAAIAVAPPRPILVDTPYACPTSAPWAIPSGSEAHPYECVVSDFGEQQPNPARPTPVVHKAPAKHHAPIKHHHAKAKHHAKKASHR